MNRCEDYPCCGHEAGDCPDSEGRMTCVECGRKLSRKATSSICSRCLRSMARCDPDDFSGMEP
jgi:hypothetical protein